MTTTPFRRLTDAERKLVEDNLGLVGYVLGRYGTQGLPNAEDAFQIGVLGLIYAAAYYDHSKAKFATFAVHCILNELRSERRAQCAKARGRGRPPLSLDAPCGTDDPNGEKDSLLEMISDDAGSVESPLEHADFMRRLHALIQRLPKNRRQLVMEYLSSGLTQQEIGERYGKSQVWVSHSLRRSFRYLRMKLAEEGEVIL